MKLRIMSNNQWKNDENTPYWEERGLDCSAAVREKGFAEIYRRFAPDIIGLQEVSALMVDYLMRNLQELGLPFALVWGRDTPILYRRDKLELVDSDFLVYPRSVPGLDGEYNNNDTKSYAVAVFRSKENGKLLGLMSTHLWWKSDDPSVPHYQAGSGLARAYQIGIAIDRLNALSADYPIPQIILGDFNTPYASDPIDMAFSKGFVHAHDVAVEYRAESNGWHPCGPTILGPYNPSSFDKAIDHILVRNAPEGFVRRFEREMPDDYLVLSDHAPVWIDVEL